MSDNKKLQNTKAEKKVKYYMSSSWKSLSSQLDEDNNNCGRETSEFYIGGAF